MANDRALVIKVSILRVSARRHEAEAEASRSSKRYKPSSNFDPSLTADLVSSSAAIYCHLLHLMPIYRSMRYGEEPQTIADQLTSTNYCICRRGGGESPSKCWAKTL